MTGASWVEHPVTSSGPRRRSRILVAVVLAVSTVLNYFVWLAWDRARDVNPVTGRETGPYEPWQIIGVGAVLLLLAFIAGWQRHTVLAIAVIPAVFTACWAIDAATKNAPDANLWPIGAMILAVGCVAGTVMFAGIASAVHDRRDRTSQATN